MATGVQTTHPVLINPELTTCESIRGRWERFVCELDIPNKSLLIIISVAAAAALFGLAVTLLKVAPVLASYSFMLAAAGTLTAILSVAWSIFKASSKVNEEMEADHLNEIHYALIKKSYYWMKAALHDSEINPNAFVRRGCTALHMAVATQDETAVELILKNPHAKAGIDLRNVDPQKAPPRPTDPERPLRDLADTALNLQHAATKFALSARKMLDPSLDPSKMGLTALQFSVALGNESIIRTLLKNGANQEELDAENQNVQKLTGCFHANNVATRDKILAILREYPPHITK